MRVSLYSLLRSLRIAIAGAVFFLFYLSLVMTGELYGKILEVLTSLQLLPSFLNVVLSGAAWGMAGFIPVLLITLLVGRIYCSVLCPLGILQDLMLFISRKISGRNHRRIHPRKKGKGPQGPGSSPGPSPAGLNSGTSSGFTVHAAVFFLTAVLATAGVPVLFGLVEPFAFWGRSFRDLIVPLGSAGSLGLVAVMKRFDVFLAPIPFRGEAGAVVLTFLMVGALGVVTVKYGRWYCNRLCPAGFVLRIFSRFSLLKIDFLPEHCTSCGLCAQSCRSGCISITTQKLDYDRCVLCMDCLTLCPVSALEIRPQMPFRQKSSPKNPDPRRRKALLVTAGSLAAGALAAGVMATGTMAARAPLSKNRLNGRSDPEEQGVLPKTPVIPPGAISVSRYTSRCISCHTCVAACPTHVLQPSFFALGVRGFLQPVMDYRAGFCEWECRACTEVCPTGAIKPVSLPDKKNLQLGRVQFLRDRCVVFTEATACGACAEVCPTQAVRMVPYVGELTQPLTDTAICSGCGSCEHACPVKGEKAIYVHGLSVHTRREERQSTQVQPFIEESAEFPF